jgi:hypothetical protein
MKKYAMCKEYYFSRYVKFLWIKLRAYGRCKKCGEERRVDMKLFNI